MVFGVGCSLRCSHLAPRAQPPCSSPTSGRSSQGRCVPGRHWRRGRRSPTASSHSLGAGVQHPLHCHPSSRLARARTHRATRAPDADAGLASSPAARARRRPGVRVFRRLHTTWPTNTIAAKNCRRRPRNRGGRSGDFSRLLGLAGRCHPGGGRGGHRSRNCIRAPRGDEPWQARPGFTSRARWCPWSCGVHGSTRRRPRALSLDHG